MIVPPLRCAASIRGAMARATQFSCDATSVPCLGPARAFHASPVALSGHNKWSKIKHKKTANDMARGAQFSSLSREIIAAIRQYRPPAAGRTLQLLPGELAPGATDPTTNARLGVSMAKAKEIGYPRAKLEASIAKAGGKKSANLNTTTYEFLGPAPLSGGQSVAIMLKCMTDSASRTNSRVKEAVNKHKCRFTKTAHFFDHVGYVRVLCLPEEGKNFDALFEEAIEAGAEDVKELDQDDLDEEASGALGDNPPEGKLIAEVLCQPEELHNVMSTITNGGFTVVAYDRDYRAGSKFYQSFEPSEDGTSEELKEHKAMKDEIEQDPDFLGWYDPDTIDKLNRLQEFLETEADAVGIYSNIDNWPPA